MNDGDDTAAKAAENEHPSEASPDAPPEGRSPAARAIGALRTARAKVNAFLARVDPNDDPTAEPLTLLPLLALAVTLTAAVYMYWRFKFQPMQDLGHHVGLSAVVTDFDRPGSLYPGLYDRPDPLNANALYYFFSGWLGRLIGVVPACRLGMTLYVVGVPLANLFALRVFGRSAWPAILSVPLVFWNMNFVGGFANLLFAGPFLVLSVPALYRALARPSWKRAAFAALIYVLVFLSHAHAFLWAGFLGFTLTFGLFVATIVGFRVRPDEPPPPAAPVWSWAFWRPRLVGAGKIAGWAAASVAPSLLVFYRWYGWAFGEGRDAGAVTQVTSGLDNDFGAEFKTPGALFHDIGNYAIKITTPDTDLLLFWKLGFLVAVAMILSRLVAWRRPPVMEMAFALTFFSYFLMPEAIDTNPVVGSRQIGIATWFLAALASPVPAHVSRLARYVVIGATAWLTSDFMDAWWQALRAFQQTEVVGLDYVLEAAPPRQHLHFVKVMPDTSMVFKWKPLWHVDKYYMAEKFGQVADNPALVSTSSIRYKAGVDFHRILAHSSDWPSWEHLWRTHELVLTHGWRPTPAQLDEAKRHAVLIRKAGNYQLWRKKGPWFTGEGPADGT